MARGKATFTKRELEALAEACGYRLNRDCDDLSDADIDALTNAFRKVDAKIAQYDRMEQRASDKRRAPKLLDENPALYDAARDACHAVGLPWTDPRTGITYPPPRREPS